MHDSAAAVAALNAALEPEPIDLSLSSVVPPAPFSASRPYSRAAADAAADLSAISDMGYHKGVWKTRYTAQRAMR